MDNPRSAIGAIKGYFYQFDKTILELLKRSDEDVICIEGVGNDSNLLIVFYVQIMPDDFVMQLHRF